MAFTPAGSVRTAVVAAALTNGAAPTWNRTVPDTTLPPFNGELIMHWLFLLMTLGALMLAFSTPHMWLLVVSLLMALLLLLLWTRGWFASRMDDTQRDTRSMIDPAELRRLRELAEARKSAALAAARDSEPQA